MGLFPQVKQFIGHSKYTYFVDVFDHLLNCGLLEQGDNPTSKLRDSISNINTALRNSGITGVTENIAILGAMTVYKLQGNIAKYKNLLAWIKKNNIGIANSLHIDDVLSIYDSIYKSMPKKVFLARRYPSEGEEAEKAEGRLSVLRQIISEVDSALELEDLGTAGSGTYYVCIRKLQLLIFSLPDLTGCRPNVMVEIGYVLKHVGEGRVLFYFEPSSGADQVPFDLSDFRYEPIADSNGIRTKVKPNLQEILDDIAAGRI